MSFKSLFRELWLLTPLRWRKKILGDQSGPNETEEPGVELMEETIKCCTLLESFLMVQSGTLVLDQQHNFFR